MLVISMIIARGAPLCRSLFSGRDQEIRNWFRDGDASMTAAALLVFASFPLQSFVYGGYPMD